MSASTWDSVFSKITVIYFVKSCIICKIFTFPLDSICLVILGAAHICLRAGWWRRWCHGWGQEPEVSGQRWLEGANVLIALRGAYFYTMTTLSSSYALWLGIGLMYTQLTRSSWIRFEVCCYRESLNCHFGGSSSHPLAPCCNLWLVVHIRAKGTVVTEIRDGGMAIWIAWALRSSLREICKTHDFIQASGRRDKSPWQQHSGGHSKNLILMNIHFDFSTKGK